MEQKHFDDNLAFEIVARFIGNSGRQNSIKKIRKETFVDGALWAKKFIESDTPSPAKAEQEGPWFRVEDRPLYIDTKLGWECTEDGDKDFIAAIPFSDENRCNKWWIRHCCFEEGIGLCVVGDDENQPAGWDHSSISHWMPFPRNPDESTTQPVKEAGQPTDEYEAYVQSLQLRIKELESRQQPAGEYDWEAAYHKLFSVYQPLRERADEGENTTKEKEIAVVQMDAGQFAEEIDRRTKIIKENLKLNMRLNMPGISEPEQEFSWQKYKTENNL